MANQALGISPQVYARTGGILYLFIIVAAGFGEIFVRGRLIEWSDASVTASNILGSETLFRLGIVAEILTCVCDVTLAMILYVLLSPINNNLALLGAFMRLTFTSIYSVTKLFEVSTLVALGDDNYLKAFEHQQIHALAVMSLRIHSYGYGMSLLFFGMCCVLFGHLISKSKYLPKGMGVLLLIGGLGYFFFSIAQMLSPSFAARFLFPWLGLPAFFAELWLCLWLIVKGVNVLRWNECTGVM